MRMRWTPLLVSVGLGIVGCGGDASGTDGSVDGAGACTSDPDCSDGVFCNGQETCDPTAPGAGDRGCVGAAAAACLPSQSCNESEARCDSSCTGAADADGDAHMATECGGDDCDDTDPTRFPGNPEVCDAADRDEDCDPATYGFRDADGDGEPDARCCNDDVCGSDCDDMRPGVNPTVPEVCGNTLDDDCDGSVDEGLLVEGYPDGDSDGWGRDEAPTLVCAGAPGFADAAGDCADDDSGRSPGATEACDTVDNNCDGMVDEGVDRLFYADRDGDSYGDDTATLRGCAPPSGYVERGGDCLDDAISTDAARVHPGAGFQTTPYCRGGYALCGTAGTWSCRPSCTGTITEPVRWDFDCNGSTQTQPASVGTCSGPSNEEDCLGALSVAGFSGPTVSRCGQPTTYVEGCRWTGLVCSSDIDTRTLGCR